jgi:hypothetical protein
MSSGRRAGATGPRGLAECAWLSLLAGMFVPFMLTPSEAQSPPQWLNRQR